MRVRVCVLVHAEKLMKAVKLLWYRMLMVLCTETFEAQIERVSSSSNNHFTLFLHIKHREQEDTQTRVSKATDCLGSCCKYIHSSS